MLARDLAGGQAAELGEIELVPVLSPPIPTTIRRSTAGAAGAAIVIGRLRLALEALARRRLGDKSVAVAPTASRHAGGRLQIVADEDDEIAAGRERRGPEVDFESCRP